MNSQNMRKDKEPRTKMSSSGNDDSICINAFDPYIRRELVMTPIDNKFIPTTSPPALCSDTKRAKRNCPFEDKQVVSKLQIFDLSDDDIEDSGYDDKYYLGDLNIRKPLRPCIVKRQLQHVALKEEKRNQSSPRLTFTNQAPILPPRFKSQSLSYSNQINGGSSQFHINKIIVPQPRHFKR